MYNKYLTGYQNPEATKRELIEVTQQYKGLEVRKEPFVFNDGSRLDLVNLQGTIPITYKLVVTEEAKSCNLRKRVTMSTESTRSNSQKQEEISRIVQNNRREAYYGSVYNIPICIWLMDSHPNNAPMCFLKPTSNMKIKISRHVDHNGKIYMPYLHDWSPNTSDLLSLIGVLIMHFSEEPPLFQVPTRNDVPMPTSSTPYPSQSFMPMPGMSGTPYPPYPTAAQPPYPVPAHNNDYQPQQQPYLPYPPYPKQGPGYPSYLPYPAASTSGSDSTGTGTITEQHIHASLLSAVEDKVRRRLREQLSQTEAELKTLDKIQQELTQGKNRLDHLLSKLEIEQNEWEKNLTILRDKEQELDESLSKLSDQKGIDVDEAVTTTAPLYKQLLNAFAEEAATEDVIYYLGEALRRGVIDLDVFLKHVRTLSRKQFMLRALMQKCRAKARLAG